MNTNKLLQPLIILNTCLLITLLILIWINHNNLEKKLTDKETFASLDSARAKQRSVSFFKSKASEPIEPQSASNFQNYFERTAKQNLRFPSSIFIDNEFIEAIRGDNSIDGLRVIFMAYDASGTSPQRRTRHEGNDVSLILALTREGIVQRDLLFDYGDPCIPPCNKNNLPPPTFTDSSKKKK